MPFVSCVVAPNVTCVMCRVFSLLLALVLQSTSVMCCNVHISQNAAGICIRVIISIIHHHQCSGAH